MEGICVNVLNPDQFFPIPQGTLPSQPIFWQNYLPSLRLPALIALAFRNGRGYRYLYVRINSLNDASISCENFLKFGPVTPELTELICERQVRHGQKLAHLVEYLRIYSVQDQFSQSFHHTKALYVHIMNLYLIFQFVEGRCHGDQIILRKCYECRLIPLAFVTLVPENKLKYYGLAVHINSGDDGATSSKNSVNFCRVTPEMTGLICVPMYLYWAIIDLTPAFVVLPF